MTLIYHLSELKEELSADIPDYPALETWLWSLGAGHEKEEGQTRGWWVELYHDLAAGKGMPCRIGRGRSGIGGWVEIVGAS